MATAEPDAELQDDGELDEEAESADAEVAGLGEAAIAEPIAEPVDDLDTLGAELQQLDRGALADYRDLALRLHRGERPPAQQIRAVLIGARKTGADLQRRIGWLRELDAAEKIRLANAGAAAAIVALNEARAPELTREKAEAVEMKQRHVAAHGRYSTELGRLNRMEEKANVTSVEICRLGNLLDEDLLPPGEAPKPQREPFRVTRFA